MISDYLSAALGRQVSIYSKTPLSGGDINSVFKLTTNQGEFCLKQNERSRFPKMLKKEAHGLSELLEKSSFQIPKVLASFEDDQSQFLVMEYVASGRKSAVFWEDFGCKLAEMHQQSADQFGWVEDNYIGSLNQSNKRHSNWETFYAEERILPQVQMAFDSHKIDSQFVRASEQLCTKFNDFFPTESPALLHGDLWSGNFMVNSDGMPVLIDPAVYYGHREMDLGMMHLFGGFSEILFETYNDQFPLEHNWKERIPLTQLYPLLVHVNLFGGSYVQSARSVIQRYS